MRLGGRSDADFDDFALSAWPRLRWSAYLLCGDHQLAEDLAQTALVRTYARWGSVRRADAMVYTRKVLVNLNIDRVRRKRPLEAGELDPDDLAAPDRTSHSDDRDEVVRLLAALTERERRVVVLRHYFDLPEAVVADELGIAPGTVKSTLSRALAKLRADHLSGQTVANSTRGRTS